MRQSLRVTICNKKGLHARAAARFVKTVEHFGAEVTVQKADIEELSPEDAEHAGPVGGNSLLGLMMLGADKGTELDIFASGEDAEAVLGSLQELIENRFEEDE